MSTLPDGYSYQVDVDDCETETALIFELDARGFDATAIEIACTMWHDDNAQRREADDLAEWPGAWEG